MGRTTVALGDDVSVFIGGVDPRDRDRVHLRTLGTSDRLLVSQDSVSGTGTLVVAGHPEASFLYRKLTGDFAGLACAKRSDATHQSPTACGRDPVVHELDLRRRKRRQQERHRPAGATID
jgi:hypothetical protein